jgi:alcohol dehydrogenase class IV
MKQGLFMKEVLALRKLVVPEVVFGVDAALLAGQYAENLGVKKSLVVTDNGVEKCGWVSLVKESLANSGVESVIFNKVSSNPRDYEVMEGEKFYRESGCDSIVAIGGGSSMDCAKGIGIVSTNGAHIRDFEGVDMVRRPGPPLICIPTTAGSSADVSQFAIISDTVRKVKISIVSKATVPDVALVDPKLTLTMDANLTASTGMDALTHAFEAYVSNANSAVTDLFALDAISMINSSLPEVIRDPENLENRGRVMLGSMEAGFAFSNAILGAVHALAHSLGGFLDLPHGECNAILLPYVVRKNFDYAADRYRVIAENMGLDTAGHADGYVCDLLVDHIEKLKHEVGLVRTLKDFGMTADKMDFVTENALNDACMVTNPVNLTIEDVVKIYEAAL